VPTSITLPSSELLEQVAAIIPEQIPLYLTGGAVRDALLGRRLNDYDFALPEQVLKYARLVANRLGAAFVPLDEERDTARLFLKDSAGQRIIMDFAAYRGSDLLSDLQGRDFTVNAMAIDLRQENVFLDPLGGAADLHAKRLRACSPTAMSDDPVRIIRAVRLVAAYNFHILPETRRMMRAAVESLPVVSPERQRDELFKIFTGPQPQTCIRALDMLDALPHVLPELGALKGVTQSPPHIDMVWEHTLGVMQQLENVLQALHLHYEEDSAANLILGLLVMHLGRYRQEIDQHIEYKLSGDHSRRGLLFLAALYHDIGKPSTRSIDELGKVRFFEHQAVGEAIIATRARSLRFSNLETKQLMTIVSHHLRPILLSQGNHEVTRRAIYRFFRDTGAAGVDICLLSLADVLATYGPTLSAEHWTKHLTVVRTLLQAWWEKPQESISPPTILDGNELMDDLKLQPGPIVGQLLETIREHQASGLIQGKDEAIILAKSLLRDLEGQ